MPGAVAARAGVIGHAVAARGCLVGGASGTEVARHRSAREWSHALAADRASTRRRPVLVRFVRWQTSCLHPRDSVAQFDVLLVPGIGARIRRAVSVLGDQRRPTLPDERDTQNHLMRRGPDIPVCTEPSGDRVPVSTRFFTEYLIRAQVPLRRGLGAAWIRIASRGVLVQGIKDLMCLGAYRIGCFCTWPPVLGVRQVEPRRDRCDDQRHHGGRDVTSFHCLNLPGGHDVI